MTENQKGFILSPIDEIIEKAIELMDIDIKNITLIREYDPSGIIVLCEPSEIEQVILNLIKNASQAIDSNPQQSSPQIIIRTIQKNEYEIQIEVEDNGPGMDENF